MSRLKLLLAVSQDPSDIYFANQLARRHSVSAVLIENQLQDRDSSSRWIKLLKLLPHPRKLYQRMYNALVLQPKIDAAFYNHPDNLADFGHQGETLDLTDSINVYKTPGPRDINSAETIAWVKAQSPDLIAVCGTSLMKAEFIESARLGLLNLHGGLSQAYRGLWTTDWAIYNRQPEYVGATVHFVAPGIDDGNIVYQGRPQIQSGDNPHTLYEKVVKLGVDMMSQAIEDVANDRLKSTPLTHKGDLYLEKDYDHFRREETWRRLQQGVIEDYLANQAQRDAAVIDSLINPFRKDPDKVYSRTDCSSSA